MRGMLNKCLRLTFYQTLIAHTLMGESMKTILEMWVEDLICNS